MRKSYKKAVLLSFNVLIVLVFISLNGAECEAQNSIKATVIKDNAELRAAPNKDSEVLAEIQKYLAVFITNERGEWYYVNYNDKMGWILKESVSTQKEGSPKVYEGEPPEFNDKEPDYSDLIDKGNSRPKTMQSELKNRIYQKALSRRKYRIGVKISGGINNFTGSEEDFDKSFSFGIAAGARFSYRFANRETFLTELLYSTKGAELNGENSAIGYLEIPMLYKHDFIGGEAKSYPYLAIGPYFAAKLSEPSYPDAKVNDFDFGFNACFGIGWNIKRSALDFQIEYSLGLTPVFPDYSYKHKVVALSAVYNFIL